jgi:hypothetical protein
MLYTPHLKVLYSGTRNSYYSLAAAALSTAVFTVGGSNNPAGVTADDPRGALDGMVGSLLSDGTIGLADTTGEANAALGLFINPVRGSAYSASSAVESGKGVLFEDYGLYECDIYELRNDADNADNTYSVGDRLYCSLRGMITKDSTSKTRSIGICLRPATASNPYLLLKWKLDDLS